MLVSPPAPRGLPSPSGCIKTIPRCRFPIASGPSPIAPARHSRVGRTPRRSACRTGLNTNHIYELVYTAKDPIVMGLGLAALRDVSAFFHNAATDDNGAANPLAVQIAHTLLNGISQSGRLLRTYLELGFNED